MTIEEIKNECFSTEVELNNLQVVTKAHLQSDLEDLEEVEVEEHLE